MKVKIHYFVISNQFNIDTKESKLNLFCGLLIYKQNFIFSSFKTKSLF